MSEAANALLALKNAWTGAVEASEAVRALAPQVASLSVDTPIADVDLRAFHDVVLTQANAVQALRGLVEQLQRKYVEASSA